MFTYFYFVVSPSTQVEKPQSYIYWRFKIPEDTPDIRFGIYRCAKLTDLTSTQIGYIIEGRKEYTQMEKFRFSKTGTYGVSSSYNF